MIVIFILYKSKVKKVYIYIIPVLEMSSVVKKEIDLPLEELVTSTVANRTTPKLFALESELDSVSV